MGLDWEKANARDRGRAANAWTPKVRPDYVSPAERKQVLAIAAAYADRNAYCARLVKECGTGIGRGITERQAEAVYRISREQAARTPRARDGRPGARDFQTVADMYR